jgi:hypothetical protein
LKEKKQEKRYGKYHKIAREFFNEDYKKANRKAREAIHDIKKESVRNLDLEMDFYLIGIDVSIKFGNPDRALIKEGESLASNDPAIMLEV